MKKYTLKLSALIIISFLFFSCKNDSDNNDKIASPDAKPLVENPNNNNLSNQSETVEISGLEWTTKNLDVSTFRNGDTIFHAKTDKDWERAGKLHIPAYCYYENNSSNGNIYGKLYNWYAVMDERGLAPEGYYIPNDDEFWILLNHNGMYQHSNSSIKMQAALKLQSKSSGSFQALLGGIRYEHGGFSGINKTCSWWSSENFWNKKLNSTTEKINPSDLSIDENFAMGPGAGMLDAGCGFSVRCIKGNINRTTKIPVLESEYIEVDKNGIPKNGVWTIRSPHGSVLNSKTFVNGIENGVRFSYDNYGYLISEEVYKGGQLNGLSIYYNGSRWKHKTHEGNYVNGKKEGEWIFYDWLAKPELAEKWEMSISRRIYYKNDEMIKKVEEKESRFVIHK